MTFPHRSAVTDELLRLIERLPAEDMEWFVAQIRERVREREGWRSRDVVEIDFTSEPVVDSETELDPGFIVMDAQHQSTEIGRQEESTGSAVARRQVHGATVPPPNRSNPDHSTLRWPHLGPAAVGAAVLMGWGTGALGGPLVAMLGAALGLVAGDRLDQHTSNAADA